MNVSIEFKKFHNKILVHMKTFDATIDPNLVPFKVPKVGLYVSFRICPYEQIYMYFDKRQGFYTKKQLNKKPNIHFLTLRPPSNDLNNLENG